MPETLFSNRLQKHVVLAGAALEFYSEFNGDNQHMWRQSLDVADYITLADLGYTIHNDRNFFSEFGHRVDARQIVQYGIRPYATAAALTYLSNGGNNVREGAPWFAEALGALTPSDLDNISPLMLEGWSHTHAIIIAAFPERRDRMKEVVDNGLNHYGAFFGTNYDLSMVARLLRFPGVHRGGLKEILDKGFTEDEIKGFGYKATSHFSVKELRSVIIKPSYFKNIFSMFAYEETKPSVLGIEGLYHLGIENGKQFKAFAKTLGLRFSDKDTLPAVTLAANVMTLDELIEIVKIMGSISSVELREIQKMTRKGNTVQEYIAVLNSVVPEVEEKFRLRVSTVSLAAQALAKGLSPAEVSKRSQEGICLADM